MTPRKALITGITGMDGSLMADLLLSKGYQVHGMIRRASTFNTTRIQHIYDRVQLHYGDMTDPLNLYRLIEEIKPDEIYNFAAQSHVKVSSELEHYTFQVNTIGLLHILQAVRKICPSSRVYHASTSEEFGNETDGTIMLNEDSPKKPVSIYGISKLAAEHICRMYRDAFGLFVVSSTLFNHDGPRRGHTFMTQKISNYVGKGDFHVPLQLGNLNARRDIGSAKDYVECIYKMMQQDQPESFVIATGETHSVREFVELAFQVIGITIGWRGTGLEEVGYNTENDTILVTVNPRYFRDIDIECLLGNPERAHQILGWTPTQSFPALVSEMVHSALERRGNVHEY
jgi:GDPmannose 4,6-dehydratase